MTCVVVLLTGSKCEEYPDTRCVMDALGPFATREEARAEAARWPDWTSPHVVTLLGPGTDR